MKRTDQREPNQRLIDERIRRHWTQQEVADQVGTTPLNVSRWERGLTLPRAYFRQQLCTLFGKSAEKLGLAPAEEEAIHSEIVQQERTLSVSEPELWNVPQRRNPFFTGRERVLSRLRKALQADKAAAIAQVQAVSGLGGIGKTQLAIEYAYRSRGQYRAVFWVRAETRDLLFADCAILAQLLRLPQQQEGDPMRLVEGVKRWLQGHTDWLLVLDNVEDLAIIDALLPPTGNGHLLLTTRAQATGPFAQRFEMDCMEPEEGALFVLRRAKLITPGVDLSEAPEALHTTAQVLCEVLGGLPLALDQAGAYIEETGCSLEAYLDHYQHERAVLLDRRGDIYPDHPLSVHATLSLCLIRVEQSNPAATDVLRLCAFLQPDSIAEEIISAGASELGQILAPVAANAIALDGALASLRTLSLLHRNAESKTLVIHRLVQAVIKDSMDVDSQRSWAERAVRAVNHAFPETNEFIIDAARQRILPQGAVCASLIEEWNIISTEAGRLLNQMGNYLQISGRLGEAERFLQQALHVRQRLAGAEGIDVAEVLNDLAFVMHRQGKYAEAEAYGQRALTLTEQALGEEHMLVSIILNNMMLAASNQGKYPQAEALGRRALAITERTLGGDHVAVARCLNNLALLYRYQGKYTQAEQLQKQALAICERALSSDHPYLALTLNNLALVYFHQGHYKEAKPLYERALAIGEQALGPDHLDVARYLHNLAMLNRDEGAMLEAEQMFQRALQIRANALGSTHLDVVATIEQYATLLRAMGREREANELLLTSLASRSPKSVI